MSPEDPAIIGHGVVAIIRQRQRYLMIQRAPHIRAPGCWCFVGGGIEPGETQPQALVREVREEVGLAVRPVAKVWECRSVNGDWLLHCWTATPLSGRVIPNRREVADYGWMTTRDICALPNVIPSVMQYLEIHDPPAPAE